jgi:hypothetical protein
VINEQEFALGQSSRIDIELRELKEIVRLEGVHAQPVKQGICIAMLICVITMNLLMPSESSPSIVGIEACSGRQFSLQMAFFIICAGVSMYAIKLN